MNKYRIHITELESSESFADASKEELRVLLALISKDGNLTGLDLAALAHTSKARAAASLAFWQEAGIISENKDSETQSEDNIKEEYENGEEPEESSVNVAKEIKNKGLASLLSECARLMKKPMLSSTEAKKIVTVYTKYALNEEFIITLAAFLDEQNKLTAVRLATDAENLVKKGIDCVEELEIYMAKKTKTSGAHYEYKRFFKIFDRPLSDDEAERAERWFGDFGYSEAIVGLAYSITTTNKGRLEIPYMDAILTSWHESGCKTVDDCRAQNEKFKEEWRTENAKEDAQPSAPSTKKTKKKPRYGDFDVADAFAKALERSYSDSDTPDDTDKK